MPRGTQDTSYFFHNFVYGTVTLYGQPFQAVLLLIQKRLEVLQPRNAMRFGLDCSHFARRYSGNRIRFLFLQVLRCFTSLGLLHFW